LNKQKVSVPRFIAFRYVNAGKRSHLVSFMSTISIAGLSLGVAILITVLSVINGFDREMRDNILGVVPHITIISNENMSLDSWNEIQSLALPLPDISEITPVIQEVGIISTDIGNKSVLVNGVDARLESDTSVLSQFFLEGGLVELSDNRWGIVIGKTLSEFLGVKVGDSINLYSTDININPLIPIANYREFEVVGVFKVGNQELDANLVIANIEASRALFRLRSPFNGLRIKTADVLEANENLPILREMLPATVQVSSWSDQFGAVYENIRFSRTIIGFMLWLLIGVAAFNLVVSLTMIVRDKKGDIAILRTLGASPELIHRIFLWQGGLIGFLGVSIGVFLGIISSLQVTRFAEFIEGLLSIKILNAEIYPIDFLPSQLHIADVLIVIFGVMLLSLLATIYPARRASAIRPAEALRSE
tara:strand:+ start:80 stop:1339 length:1260 start_codon:yes stop_codon:yes gene_type:complete